MTEKLYYENAYIKHFTAEVLLQTESEKGFDLILDKTAFFPEEGGQSADTGRIGDATVLDVYEKDGVVHHIVDRPISQGTQECTIDFELRFEKMQCHTSEHILCGIIHRLFGFDNVGFHLGDDVVTFDVSGVLTREDIDKVESLANSVVFSNVQVDTFFPRAEELENIQYRSKLDLSEGVRLVKIGDVDICACCAPHVSKTGEIGIIKILDFMKHRGGTRIFMVAGKRALEDYRARYNNIKRISATLCTPQLDTADTLDNYVAEAENAKSALKLARIRIAELEAEKVEKTSKNRVFVLSDFSIPELIAFTNIASKKIDGITVALSGVEGDYKYVIASHTVDMREKSKDINSSLSGRGGGRPEMIQGSFGASLLDIKEYFK